MEGSWVRKTENSTSIVFVHGILSSGEVCWRHSNGTFVDNWRTPHTKDLHTVERWKIIDGGKAIEATVMVDDPHAFNAPWSGLVRWTKMNGPLMESVCAENNENYGKFLGLREYPMPQAKTPDF